MTAGLAACSSSKPAETSQPNESEPAEAMKVVMVTDYGDITDQSFNQTTYEAAKAYCEAHGLEFTYKKPASEANADREASIEEAIEEGYNVVLLPGFAFAQTIVDITPMYPDVKFVALDVSGESLNEANGGAEFKQDNLYSAVYQEEIAGYMAGVATVKLGYKKLGFLGGAAVPAVVRYGFGFVQGADDAAKELGLTDVEINYTYGGQFFGDADITAVMDTWFQGGTEAVFASGGGIFTSVGEAASKVGGKIIGVDVDQSKTIDDLYGEGTTITSAMKGLTATVNTMLAAIEAGEWDKYKGQVQNLGMVSENPEENFVELPKTTVWGEGFTEDDYKALVSDIYNGKVEIENGIDEMPATEVVKVNSFKPIKG